MKWILNVFLLGLVLMNPIALAADAGSDYVSVNPIVQLDLSAVESKCATLDYNGTPVVDPQDFSICKNDISYGIIQMVFQKIFSENEILPALADHENDDGSLAYAYNIGGPIIAVIEAVTWLTFTLSGFILTVVTIKTLNLSASSGQFMGNWNSVYVMTRTLGAMALIVPVGSFSFAQIIILVMSLFAIMGGNYIWGAFLSMQQAGSVILNEESSDSAMLAKSQAESLVKSNSCALRSSSASVEIHQKNMPTGFVMYADADTHMSRLASCSRYRMYVGVDETFSAMRNGGRSVRNSAGRLSQPANVFPISSMAFGSPVICNGVSDFFNKYDPELYGKSYQCGNIQFLTASLEEFDDLNSDKLGDSWYNFFDNSRQDVVNTVGYVDSALSPTIFYREVADKAYINAIDGKIFDPNDYVSEVEKFKTVVSKHGSDLFDKLRSRMDSNAPNPPVIYEATYVALSAIFSKYMGGTYHERYYNDFWQDMENLESKGWFSFSTNKAIQIRAEYEKKLKFSPMYEDARLASAYILSAQCARIWGTEHSRFSSSKKTLDFLDENEDDTFRSLLKSGSMGSVSSECIVPLNMSDLAIDKSVMEILHPLMGPENDSDDVFYLALAEVDGKTYRDQLISVSLAPNQLQDSEKEALELAKNAIVLDSTKKAKAKIEAMTAYNYVIRSAMEDAIVEIFKKKTDTDFLINMRDLGWASAGGFILSLSNNGSDLDKYNKKIQSQISWSENVSNEMYLHPIVLNAGSDSFEYNSMVETIKNIYLDQSINTDYTTLNKKDVYELDIFKELENLLSAPLSHLKQVGGFAQDETLREGAKQCYEAGNCTITSVHPVTALLNVGNDLIELCMNLIVLKTITGAIVWATTQGSSSEGADASNSKMMSMTGALSKNPYIAVFIKLVEFADSLLGVLTSVVVPPLFLVGIFFSFVIPMMPFLAFLMGFIGWIMLILELLIAVNVWILLMATPDQNGSSRADPRALFSFAGQLVLKPALMVVALVFGWYLSAISVYFLNMTIFGALSPTESGTFMGLLDLFMFYIVYLIMIFIAIKHSFKIIEILPDKIFSLINISKSGDVKSESLGMERLVQIAAGEKVMQLAATPMNMIDQKKEKSKYALDKFHSESTEGGEKNQVHKNSYTESRTDIEEKERLKKEEEKRNLEQEANDRIDKAQKAPESNPDGSDKKPS